MNGAKRMLKRWRMHTPRTHLGKVFEDVQMSGIFTDSKTFADSTPRVNPRKLRSLWRQHTKRNQSVDYEAFVREHFVLPEILLPQSARESHVSLHAADIRAYIGRAWHELKRNPSAAHAGASSSLLPLPRPYIVPGGRYSDIYYWDSYFTMLGLKESGEIQTIEDMVYNFAHLVRTYGHVPNGNRSYLLSRSQPPFFSLMVQLLVSIKGQEVYRTYLHDMVTEYNFWMFGQKSPWFMLGATNTREHVVRMPGGEILNRYYDLKNEPREESYREDVATHARATPKHKKQILRNLRAAAESGWDFSSRWCEQGADLATTRTLDIVAVDLNAILVMVEEVLAEAHEVLGDTQSASYYRACAEARAAAIRKYCWDEEYGWFCDYVISEKKHSSALTLAGMFPLFAGVATHQQAERAAAVLREKFLCPGGLIPTCMHTDEQWDAPNGWAPLQHVSIMGLERYEQSDFAREIAQRWCRTVIASFKRDGVILEKYNVEEVDVRAGGGEYVLQQGFGWTNGVTLFLMNRYGIE